MDLEHLPEELLVLIIKLLDLKSIYTLYDAGIPHVQNVIGSGFIKKCDLSLSNMASKNTFNTPFFLDISAHLLELNLRGVQDLTMKSLLPTISRLENLSTLNLAYTNITIFDFIDIYDHCPSIKNISIDYQFKDNKDTHFSQEMLAKCQEVFANMKTVHFVGSANNLLYSSLPQIILQKANLTSLTYTLAKHSDMMTYYKYSLCDSFNHNNFNIFVVDWRDSPKEFPDTEEPVMLKDLHLRYDFLQIIEENVYCSPVFKPFFEKYFSGRVSSCLPKSSTQLLLLYGYLKRQTAVMCWNKTSTTYDENFFQQLFLVLLPLFPLKLSYVESEEYSDEDMEPSSSASDFIHLKHIGESDDSWNANMFQFPTKRRIKCYNKMDYDELLDKKEKVELAISFINLLDPISLSSNLNFLPKLTYLSLTPNVTFSPDFFSVLFRCSINLLTLNIETSDNSCMSQISKHIGLSRTLKNFRLRTKAIKYHKLFSVKGICVCKSLENVIIIDTSSTCVKNVGEPEHLITFCENLYYLCIEINMNENIRVKTLKMLNRTKKTMERPHVFIELTDGKSYHKYTYDPFIEVFKLGRIKSLVI